MPSEPPRLRLNRFIAQATGLSRRAADKAIVEGRAKVNGVNVSLGQLVTASDRVNLDGRLLSLPTSLGQLIMLNKPRGYVCSRAGQGSKTVYDLLPIELYNLKPVGRLDKDSSGLLLLTNDGDLAHQLTHPSFNKQKTYELKLNRLLKPQDASKLTHGVKLSDGLSKMEIKEVSGQSLIYKVSLNEGRNRQIRRTFATLGYSIQILHRIQFGPYSLGKLGEGKFTSV